jgi:hypothetical protein
VKPCSAIIRLYNQDWACADSVHGAPIPAGNHK